MTSVINRVTIGIEKIRRLEYSALEIKSLNNGINCAIQRRINDLRIIFFIDRMLD